MTNPEYLGMTTQPPPVLWHRPHFAFHYLTKCSRARMRSARRLKMKPGVSGSCRRASEGPSQWPPAGPDTVK
jgi:hypothetical protein